MRWRWNFWVLDFVLVIFVIWELGGENVDKEGEVLFIVFLKCLVMLFWNFMILEKRGLCDGEEVVEIDFGLGEVDVVWWGWLEFFELW